MRHSWRNCDQLRVIIAKVQHASELARRRPKIMQANNELSHGDEIIVPMSGMDVNAA